MDGPIWTMGRFHRLIALLALQWFAAAQPNKPNLVFIVADQYRFDAIRFVQDMLPWYRKQAKIKTPNLDRLAAEGIAFFNAYCQLPSCAAARATLFTGCTIERTGVQANNIIKGKVAERNPELFLDKINKLESFEQLLVEERGYVAENYGKWHFPERFYYTRDGRKRVIQYNDYDFKKDRPKFDGNAGTKSTYNQWFKRRKTETNLKRPKYGNHQLDGAYFGWPYTPIKLDERYGETKIGGRTKNEGIRGWGTLDYEYSQTYFQGWVSRMAMKRLAKNGDPFSLVINFSSPHPPMETSAKYVNFYRRQIKDMYVPRSNRGDPPGSAYGVDKRSGYVDKFRPVQEWTAIYYALAQEIDDAVGELLDDLDKLGVRNETLVLFTADHGEMLGAHGFSSKSKFFDEASRVPLIMSFPGVIPEGEIVNVPVSHLDVFATVLDYLNAGKLDKSDGRSLRPLIEGEAFNEDPGESMAVAEMDQRYPINSFDLRGKNGDEPNFMIRYGDYKLMMPKMASSKVPDMLFDLSSDPIEMRNLLRGNPPDWVIGKAEQLKLLLVDWMKDKDGPKKYYSLPKWNAYEGGGDITEIGARRKWKKLDYWVSDRELGFGRPRKDSKSHKFIRHEYLHVGRTTPGQLDMRVWIMGRDEKLFTCKPTMARIREGESVRLTMSYTSDKNARIRDLKADIVIKVNGGDIHRIPIVESLY